MRAKEVGGGVEIITFGRASRFTISIMSIYYMYYYYYYVRYIINSRSLIMYSSDF